MTDTHQRILGAYVSKNTPLSLLYAIGGLALGIGIIIAVVATANGGSGNPLDGASVNAVAAAWQLIGNAVAFLGALSLIGGAVAHAINWQIINR